MTTITKLVGSELIDFVDARTQDATRQNVTLNRTAMCMDAGYLYANKEGSVVAAYTEFYEALLAAKQERDPDFLNRNESNMDWYDNLSRRRADLYDQIEDMCPEFTKLDGDQCDSFMDELSDLGIETAEQFEEAYCHQSDSWNAESEFAEYWMTDVCCEVNTDMVVYSFIDWQRVWDHQLRYDMNTIEFDGTTYFFHNI